MQLPFEPMPLLKRAAPFDHPDWIFELKYDGNQAACSKATCSKAIVRALRASCFTSN